MHLRLCTPRKTMVDPSFKMCFAVLRTTSSRRLLITTPTSPPSSSTEPSKKSQNSHSFEHIYIYQDLEAPYARRISDLEAFEQSPDSFERDIGSSDEYAFHEALWICNTLFSKAAKKQDSKRIFLLTNNDNPNAGKIDLQRSAMTRANDLHDTGAILHLFYLKPPGREFDYDVFFKDKIVKMEEDDTGTNHHDATGKLDDLLKQVRQKEFKKRTAFRIPFILGDDFEFGVQGYNLVAETKLGTYTYLVAATNEEVAVVTSYICKTTAQQLSVSDMDSYYLYGGKKVVFSKEEVAAIKTFGEPGLRLIGFKPLAEVLRKPYYNLKHSSFLFPDEEGYSGSSAVFIQFLARVSALQKAVICSFVPRKNATPRLVALLPQLEEFDGKGNVLRPSGFHLIHIPFSDDVRKPPAPEFDSTIRIPILQEAIGVVGEMIDKTTLKNFSCDNYENPTIQKHYENLQAIALKRDMAADFFDHTLPNEAAIQKRIGRLVARLEDTLPEPEVPQSIPSTPRKRKQVSDPPTPRKKEKVAPPSSEDVKALWENGQLKKLTVVSLTAFLLSVGVAPAKKKDDLIQQVDDHFSA
ncbi:SPOC like C-terminal domain-containing protein [Zopfochytrium polystomum]|nr:SPOC like C-terminal domain-containing protein [Zopfochytrium polystomum]